MNASDILKKVFINAINHLLTLVAAYLISKGIVSKDILSPENLGILAAGAVAAGISAFMVIYRRIKEKYIMRTALAAPANTSPAVVVKAAKDAMKAETSIPNMLVQ